MSKELLTMDWTGKYPLGVSALALAFTIAACSPPATQDNPQAAATLDNGSAALPPLPAVLPLAAGPATPVRYAPAAAALPRARALGYARASDRDRYAWIDRADRISDTIGDAPPDYAFDYEDGVEPYGWETSGGYRTYAEPVDGGYRYYYYDQGADAPYLVRDPYYSYGYSGGRIVTVYDRGGRALAEDQAARKEDTASRYYQRARALRAAADARQRRGVIAAQWADRRPAISGQHAEWDRARDDDPEWRAYRNDHPAEDQRLVAERDAREQAARHFGSWQEQGFQGNAPALYGPRTGDQRSASGFAPQQQAQQAQVRAQQQQAANLRDKAQQQQIAQQIAQQRAAQLAAQQQAAQQRAQDQQRAQQQARQQADQRAAAANAQLAAQRAQTQDQALRVRQEAVIAQQRKVQQAQANQQRDAQRRAVQQHVDQVQLAQQRAIQARAQQQRAVAAQADQARAAQRQQALVQQRAVQQRAIQQNVGDQRQRQAEQANRIAQAKLAAAQAQQARQAAQLRAVQQQQAQAAAVRNAAIAREKDAKRPAAIPHPQPPHPPAKPQPLPGHAPEDSPRGDHRDH